MTERTTWKRAHLLYLVLTLALTVFAVAPLAYPGYIQVHSSFIPIYNLTDLAGGQSELVWTPDVATSFNPLRGDGLLPYYLALPLVWLGLAPSLAVKVIFGLSFLLGATGIYFLLCSRLSPPGAALAALVYTYLPYRIAVVYVRGAWGEALLLGLLPWALACTQIKSSPGPQARRSLVPHQGNNDIPKPRPRALRLVCRNHFKGALVLTALLWVLVSLSQPGLAIWGMLFLAGWWLLVDRKQANYRLLPAALGGGILGLTLTFLGAGFRFPPSLVDFFDHFTYPAQLLAPFWGLGASRPGWDDGLSLSFGFAAVGLTMLTGILWPRWIRRNINASNMAKSSFNLMGIFAMVLVLTLLALPASTLFWKATGLHHTLTYPWQLLGLAGLGLSILAGTAPKLDESLTQPIAYASLIILTLLTSYSYLEPRFTQHQPAAKPLANWDAGRLLLLDYELSVQIPPAAAGLNESTPRQLALDDYGPPRPGDTLHLRVTWQATRPFYRDLKIFLHLVNPSGKLVAQVDPLAGASDAPEEPDYLTSEWDPGEVILDDIAITIPPDAAPGRYRLALGLYDGDTLERLPVMGQDTGQIDIQLELSDREISLPPLTGPGRDTEHHQ